MSDTEVVVWLDLETTGLDPARCQILEVGLALGSSGTEPFSGRLTLVVAPDAACEWDPVALKMHERSGLLAEARASALSEKDLDGFLNGWLEQGGPIVLAGHSVHFDHAFLRARCPLAARRLSHRVLDVSSIRRLMQDAGYPVPERRRAHRASEDAWEARAEYEAYVEALKNRAS